MSRLSRAEDSIVCVTTQTHRLSAKAYQAGGQGLQNKFNAFIFDACLAKGADISDDDFLVDAAVKIGLMNKEEVWLRNSALSLTDLRHSQGNGVFAVHRVSGLCGKDG